MALNSNNLYFTIGKKIKTIRKEMRFAQEELANKISLSRSSLSNIEIGKHQPSLYTLYEIALALNCEIQDLLPSIDDYKLKNEIDKKYSEVFFSLPEDTSKKTLSILKEILKKDD